MQCQKLKTYMETGRVVFVPARSILPNPAQPRHHFDENALAELTESIRRHGILQPLSVRRVGSNYELIAGERRLRAAIRAGLGEIPCIVMKMESEESGWVALVENLQRQDLDFLEEARGIRLLMDKWGLGQEQAARLLGKSQSAIANKLRLLQHSPALLEKMQKAGLTERHARALLRLPEESERTAVLEEICRRKMSVADTEKYIENYLKAKDAPEKPINFKTFLNKINRYVTKVQGMGIGAVTERRESEGQIVFTITVQKERG